MQTQNRKENEVTMKMNTEALTPVQVRLVKSIHALMANVLASDEEGEYFDASAELLKKTAELIKHANFAVENNNISYGNQAVEFSVDAINESLDENSVLNIDN